MHPPSGLVRPGRASIVSLHTDRRYSRLGKVRQWLGMSERRRSTIDLVEVDSSEGEERGEKRIRKREKGRGVKVF